MRNLVKIESGEKTPILFFRVLELLNFNVPFLKIQEKEGYLRKIGLN